jgi:hypothetical protein
MGTPNVKRPSYLSDYDWANQPYRSRMNSVALRCLRASPTQRARADVRSPARDVTLSFCSLRGVGINGLVKPGETL